MAISKTDGSTTITITDKNGTHSQVVKDGVNGTPGATGADGKTSYFHVKYSNDGGKTFTPNNGEEVGTYIGTYSDFKIEDSTSVSAYTWAKIKGEPGVKGNDGTSVKITAKSVTYQASTSGTTTPTGVWVADPPTVAKGQYLWTKTVVTYSDGNSTTAYSVAYQGTNGTNGQNGTNGSNGKDGKGIKSTEVTYQTWENGTSTPSDTWVTTVPDTTADKPYLWTRTIITYTDNTKSTSYSVGSTLKGVNVGGRNLIRYGKGNSKKGFFKNFTATSDDYCEVTIKSKKQYSNAYLNDGFVLGCRDYTVGETYIWSYDIMYTEWNFPQGTSRHEFWIGQRYTYAPSGQTATGAWRMVTAHYLPAVGTGGCKLNEWYHVSQKVVIPAQASSNVGEEATIRLYNPNPNVEASFTARFKNVKLELGNIATDWTPAPEDVDEGINNAQSSADKAQTNASNAQQTANNAQDTANKADAKADQAISDAASASTAAQIAKKQADVAQAKSDEANRIANGAAATISPIAQVVKVDSQGLKILNSEQKTSYAQMQSTGLYVFVNKAQRSVFGVTSKTENLAVQDYLMFGAHRAEMKIEDGEEGTALFHVGDIK